MDADLELAGDVTTLKKELLPRLLEPQLAKQMASKAFLFPPNTDSSSMVKTGYTWRDARSVKR